MTLLFTESFGGFKRYVGTNAELMTAANLNAQVAAFAQVGLVHTKNDSYLGTLVVPDPVHPERSALAVIPKTGTPSQFTKLWWPIALQGAPLIFGFSLFLPSEWPDVTDTSQMIDVASGPVTFAGVGNAVPNNAARLFSIGADRRVRSLAGTLWVTQSQRQATIGGMTYFEFRVEKGSLRVWMDDALVMDNPREQVDGGISLAFAISSTLAPIYAAGSSLRPCVGNIYCLSQDAHPPNVRLGPTTRVISRRPAGDVSVNFERPDGFSSNSQVVEQDITGATPGDTLQTETVGARDEYALAANSAISNAAMVHAVVTKVVAANLEATPHVIRPWVKSGVNETVDEFAYESRRIDLPLKVNHYAAAAREDGTLFICGLGPSVSYSTDGGDTWHVGFDGAAANVQATDIAVGPDGTVMACCSNGNILECRGTDGPGVWAYASTALTAAFVGIAVSPSGTWSALSGNSTAHAVKIGATAWRTQTRTGTGHWIGWVEDRFIALHANVLQYSFTGADNTWISITGAGIVNTSAASAGVVKVGGLYLIGAEGLQTASTLGVRIAETLPTANSAITGSIRNFEVQRTALGLSPGGLRGYVKGADGLALLPGYSNAIFWTRDGINMSVHIDPLIVELGVLGRAAAVPGGFLIPSMATGLGKAVQLRKRKGRRPLINSEGYLQHTNIASLNPATGLAWTASAAASATVGMTLDS